MFGLRWVVKGPHWPPVPFPTYSANTAGPCTTTACALHSTLLSIPSSSYLNPSRSQHYSSSDLPVKNVANRRFTPGCDINSHVAQPVLTTESLAGIRGSSVFTTSQRAHTSEPVHSVARATTLWIASFTTIWAASLLPPSLHDPRGRSGIGCTLHESWTTPNTMVWLRSPRTHVF